MPKIRDYAVTIETAVTAAMVMEMPVHVTGDLLVAFVNKDAASNFATPAGWTAVQTQTSAGSGGGVYAKRAASAAETVTFTLASETCCGVVLAIKNIFGTTVADAITNSAKSGADDSTLPLTGVGITPSHNNSLILHGLSTDTGMGPSASPGWVNLFTGDAGANSLCVAYTCQRTAGAIAAPEHWAATQDDSRGFAIAIRDDGNDTEVEPYIAPGTVPCTLIAPLCNNTAADRGTWVTVAPLDIATLGGKTLTFQVGATAADSGYNPFRSAHRTIAPSSKTVLYASELRFTGARDLTANSGVVFGTFRYQIPRDYLDCGTVARGGVFVGFADASNNHRFWTIGAQRSVTTDPSSRQNYAIEVASTDTIYDSSGTPTLSAINDFYKGAAAYYGATSVEMSELYLLNEVVIAGGTSSVPLNFLDLEVVINDGSGRIPLMVRNGSAATLWSPIRFGGVDPVFLGVNLRTFQFPRKSDAVDYLDFHVGNNKLGIEFYGLAGDELEFTNCVFTSDSQYYWRFNAAHSASATVNFAGTTVVNALVTLRANAPLVGTTFVGCQIDASGASLTDGAMIEPLDSNDSVTLTGTSSINNCTVGVLTLSAGNRLCSVADPSVFEGCTFNGSASNGHAIRITTPGTYALVGNVFNNFGADASTSAAIHNDSGGLVTLDISGGGTTPTIRNGAGASTVVNNTVSLTIAAQVSLVGAEIRIYDNDDLPAGSYGTELAGVESAVGATYVYAGTPGNNIVVQVMLSGYEEKVESLAIPAINTTLTLALRPDTNA